MDDIQEELSTYGLGMGLYMTKILVEQFEGTVSVESEVNQGSTFGFTFSLRDSAPNAQEQDRQLNPNYPKRTNQILIEPSNQYADME